MMINDLKDDLGIKEFNRMSCDTHVKRDSSEIGLSIPETFNNKQTVLEDKMDKRTINNIDFTDSENMIVRMLAKRELQKMLSSLRKANKELGGTMFKIIKEKMGYSVLCKPKNSDVRVRVLNALNFRSCYSVRLDKNLFNEVK